MLSHPTAALYFQGKVLFFDDCYAFQNKQTNKLREGKREGRFQLSEFTLWKLPEGRLVSPAGSRSPISRVLWKLSFSGWASRSPEVRAWRTQLLVMHQQLCDPEQLDPDSPDSQPVLARTAPPRFLRPSGTWSPRGPDCPCQKKVSRDTNEAAAGPGRALTGHDVL